MKSKSKKETNLVDLVAVGQRLDGGDLFAFVALEELAELALARPGDDHDGGQVGARHHRLQQRRVDVVDQRAVLGAADAARPRAHVDHHHLRTRDDRPENVG